MAACATPGWWERLSGLFSGPRQRVARQVSFGSKNPVDRFLAGPADQRREHRITSREAVLVRSWRGSYERASLVNASQGGACLETPVLLDPQDVRLVLKLDDRFLTLSGRVAWSRPRAGGSQAVGLTLKPAPCDRGMFGIWLLHQQLKRLDGALPPRAPHLVAQR